MITAIHQGLPWKQAETAEEQKIPANPQNPQAPRGFGGAASAPKPQARELSQMGRDLLKRKHGEAFALHYYAAAEAAGALQGGDFLQQYRALKRVAREQGMPPEEFQRYEKCLYRRFYQTAAQEAVRANQLGRLPKVAPEELSYIAKVADIPADQLHRDALALRRSEFVAQIRILQGKGHSHPA